MWIVAEASTSNITLVAIFDFTQIFGLVLLGIVLLTAALAPSIRRSPAWFNFLSTWVLSCISYLVTLGQQTGEEPGFSVCLLQAMLVYAAPAVTVTAGLCFSIEMWRIITRPGGSSGGGALSFRDYGALGLKERELVKRDRTLMFCHIDSTIPAYVTGVVVICVILIAMGFVGRQVVNIQKMVFRFGVFTILPVFGLALSITQVSSKRSGLADGILTITIGTPNPSTPVPAGAALIFGTQSDIMRVWMFWKKPIPNTNSESGPLAVILWVLTLAQVRTLLASKQAMIARFLIEAVTRKKAEALMSHRDGTESDPMWDPGYLLSGGSIYARAQALTAGYGQYDSDKSFILMQRDCPNRTIAPHLVISGGRVLRPPPTGLFILMQIFYPVGEQLETRYGEGLGGTRRSIETGCSEIQGSVKSAGRQALRVMMPAHGGG
ncbi:hypothetical protein PLEOSDRAFT_171692 [Pleurotus ostreatus PC15]|uniref:Uncharacterized protein n=1 Tax=Pleurotus ostreatus (strain PC15) TaxID=1137138 RepID=A0A067N2M5_PLEO1|nr:hypothetical protein PLEOSDRAFT_171692 [Pleurotus ostreatus PC15]